MNIRMYSLKYQYVYDIRANIRYLNSDFMFANIFHFE